MLKLLWQNRWKVIGFADMLQPFLKFHLDQLALHRQIHLHLKKEFQWKRLKKRYTSFL